MACSNISYIM